MVGEYLSLKKDTPRIRISESYEKCENSNSQTFQPSLGMITLLVISHCGFNSHFPDN